VGVTSEVTLRPRFSRLSRDSKGKEANAGLSAEAIAKGRERRDHE